MPTVRLALSPAPRYVRTARLVAVAVARRAGVADERLDDVGLAVGEACGRAVARHDRHGVTDPVRVEMTDDGPYTVRVVDAAPEPGAASGGGAGPEPEAGGESGESSRAGAEPAGVEPAGAEPGGAADSGAGEDTDRMHESLLAALVEELEVRRHEDGTEVRMTWPVRRRLSGAPRP